MIDEELKLLFEAELIFWLILKHYTPKALNKEPTPKTNVISVWLKAYLKDP